MFNSKRSALDKARPLFLIGTPRSGTTILANMVNAHNKILLTHETSVFLQLNEIIEKNPLGRSAGILFGQDYNVLWASHIQENAKYLIESYYCKIAGLEDKHSVAYWGDKHPHFDRCLPWLHELYPNAMYIYAIRDPRDTICSIAAMNDTSVLESLKEWSRISSIYEAFIEYMPVDQLKLVKYEDLVDDYESVLSDVFTSLSLNMDLGSQDYIAEHKNTSPHDPGSPNKIEFSEVSVSRWQREMTAGEKLYTNRRCGPFLRKYGYI